MIIDIGGAHLRRRAHHLRRVTMAALAAAGLCSYKLTTTASVVRVSSRVSLSLAATGVAGAVEKSHSRVRDIGGIATNPVVKGAGACLRELCVG